MIRRADPDDIADLTRLFVDFRDWFGNPEPDAATIRATLDRLIDDPATEYLLAVDDGGATVGFCQLRYRLSVWTGVDDCWLEDLFVSKAARGGGHGRALVEAAFESAGARGCKRIQLDVHVENVDARRLYERLGFDGDPKPTGQTLVIGRRL
jgi:ribosomal protein S18 acetylase RimI-like enzyme